jgi:hypothetical protein
VLEVTVTETAVPAAVIVIEVGVTLNVGSPAACEMVEVACCPPSAVTTIALDFADVVVFAGTVSPKEKLN